MTDLRTLFFGAIPLATARSLDTQPERWTEYGFGGKVYRLHHESGLSVWVGNGPFGVDVSSAAGAVVWGGVTTASAVGLSPGHHLISRAAKRWMAARSRLAPAPESEARILEALSC